MTENLALPLAQGTPVEASYGTTTASSISTFTYTPTSAVSIGTHTLQNSYGWYYNWLAATGERGTGDDVNGSICPKGWRLPANYSVDTTRSWGTLTNTYGVTVNGANATTSTGYQVLIAPPVSLTLVGHYGISGVFTEYGNSQYLWSSTTNRYILVYKEYIKPQQDFGSSNLGFSVRCLAVR